LKKQVVDIQSIKNTEIENLKKKIVELQNNTTNLQSEINKSNQVRLEYDKVKQQLTHMDTFKNQLIELQKVVTEKDSEIEKLNQQILNLQSTPTKQKKASVSKQENLETVETTRDGGIF
jgi:chromosome segregation ATPase